jgi:hypothetical protein
MLRIKRACCCAVAALGILLIGSDVRAQFEKSPFAPSEPTPSTHQPPIDKVSQPLCHCLGEGNSASVARINKALREPLHSPGLEFSEVPLEDVVDVLEEEYTIPILLDTPALEDIGLGPDESVTIKLSDITLRSALRLMLRRLGLTYVIDNEVLIITTPDEAETELITCVYDVRDLTSGGRKEDVGRLVDTIQATTATETWAENGGGEAEICALPSGVLVISQTQTVQEQIRQLLWALRAFNAAPPDTE